MRTGDSMKRIVSALLGFPLVAAILILGNKYVIDVLFSIVAIFCIHEFYKSFKETAKPVEWVGYVLALSISFIHIIPKEALIPIIRLSVPAIILVLFAHVIATNMKTNLKDIMITLFGICYIVIFLMFMPYLNGIEANGIEIGKYLVWYILFVAWGTDILAYIIGVKFGKHKLTQISPKKSVEGSIAGIIGAVIVSLIYTFALNYFMDFNISYLYITLIAMLLSVIGQIGDLTASSIKRFNNIKDFSNLIPGHGGMLDRFDSVIFIAPFAYFLLIVLI